MSSNRVANKAVLILLLVLTLTHTVRIVQAQVLANTNATGVSTVAASDAQAIAASLVSAFAAVPASDRAALKAEAEYVLAALGSDSSLGAGPAANASTLTTAANEAIPVVAAAPNAIVTPSPTSATTSSLNSSFLKQVLAAQGPAADFVGSSAPFGSGDNLLEYQKRLDELKAWYKDYRTLIHSDDAVRIGGYIATLEALGIQFLAAYPIAELAFLVANLALLAGITSLIAGVFYTVASALGVASASIGLEIAVQQAADAGVGTGRRLMATTQKKKATTSASKSKGKGKGNSTASKKSSSTTVTLGNNQVMVDQLLTAARGINSELIPWALSDSAMGPMNVATGLLQSAATSLNRLSTYTPPGGALMNGPLGSTLGTLTNTLRTYQEAYGLPG